MNNLLNNIYNFIKNHKLIENNSTVIVGLSGGPDSTALLHILYKLKKELSIDIVATHLDHQWRTESYKDEIFCSKFCESLGIKFISKKACDIKISKNYNGSKEEVGRFLRRAFFEEIAKEFNSNAIALAHHQNDQQETFFIRLLRGSSLAGLCSMQPKKGLYIRPLLNICKQDILQYLENERLQYLNDTTNQDNIYLRNSIRNQVIPALKIADPRFDKSFAKLLEHIQQTDSFLQNIIDSIFRQITSEEKLSINLNIEEFFAQDKFLHHSLLLKWLCSHPIKFTPTTKFFDEILRFLTCKKNKQHQLGDNWCVKKSKNFASIELKNNN